MRGKPDGATRARARKINPAAAQQQADYLGVIRGQVEGQPWTKDVPNQPCATCGAAREYGELHCGVVTPPMPKEG